jgi:hypothetical protein
VKNADLGGSNCTTVIEDEARESVDTQGTRDSQAIIAWSEEVGAGEGQDTGKCWARRRTKAEGRTASLARSEIMKSSRIVSIFVRTGVEKGSRWYTEVELGGPGREAA